MKILLLAGEESGLIYRRLIAERLGAHEVRGYADYGFAVADLAVVGFLAVLRRARYFLRVKRTLERAIDEWRPDVVVTIDYPGMNLKLAHYAKARGIRAVHVVCPQVWAWRQGRIPKVEAALSSLCCFFPFEPRLFRPGFAKFVGHPLKGEFARLRAPAPATGRRRVALLPGSRRGEIERILPTLLKAAAELKRRQADLEFVIPAANRSARLQIDAQLKAAGRVAESVRVTDGRAREALLGSECAAVASGTATLEAALAGCPTVLVYRVGLFLEVFARCFVRGTKYLGLANIVWSRLGGEGEAPMPELLQEDFTVAATVERLGGWLADATARAAARQRLEDTMRLLDGNGDPIGRIVAEIEAGAKEV